MKIICHMAVSLDLKITGAFLNRFPEVSQLYYEMHREFRNNGCKAFLCGRATMQSSFTGDVAAPLEKYKGISYPRTDCFFGHHGFYAVAIDTHGKCFWKDGIIHDDDPGYDNCGVIEVLCEDIDDAFIGYLQEHRISYLFAGKEKLDISLLREKLETLLGIHTLLLEGGGVVNESFRKAGAIDELSLPMALVIEGNGQKDLFQGTSLDKVNEWEMEENRMIKGCFYLRLRKRGERT